MAGYSGTTLLKKLGLKPGQRVSFINEPAGFRKLLAPLPRDLTLDGARPPLDFVIVFAMERAALARELERQAKRIAPDAMLWVGWPKKASRVPTDITEDVVRAVALPMGLVDVKVCAIDDTWSGLKLVIRKENRGKR